MNKSKYVILFLSIMTVSCVGTVSAQSGSGSLQKRVDSIFVIASSGEVKYRDFVQPAIDSMALMGEAIVPLLIDKFVTKSARERLTIINILKKIGSPAVPYLVKALTRPNNLVVSRVCWALGDIKDSSAVPPLIRIAGHESWWVREKAIDALGKIADPTAQDLMMVAMNDEIGQVRKAACVAMGPLRMNFAIRELTHSLGDKFYGARMSAFETLTKLDTAMVVLALSDSMISENQLVGILGCQILGRLATDEARDVLLTQAESQNAERRAQAAVAIIFSDPGNQCGHHEHLLENETDRISRIKIESAIHSAQNVTRESNQ